MKRSLARVSHSLAQPVRVRAQSIPRSISCLLTTSPQYAVRRLSFSGTPERNELSARHRQKQVLEQMENNSATEEIATTDFEVRNSLIRKVDSPRTVAPSAELFVGEDAFEDWITYVVRADRRDRRRYLKWEQGVMLKALQIMKDTGATVNVNFDDNSTTNTLKSSLVSGMTRAFNKIAATESINGVCLTSGPSDMKDTHFCAGANFQDLLSLKDPDTADTFIRQISGLCTAIRNTPVPVVALISKSCIGAGLEVAASCDIRVATKDARFSMPEVLLGIPSVVEARLLCDIVGWARARHLMLTGHVWTAQEAYEAGLVTKVFENEEQMGDWAASFMRQLNGDSVVYRMQKKLMLDWENQSVDQGVEAGAQCFANSFAQADRVKKIQKTIRDIVQKSGNRKKGDKQSREISAAGQTGDKTRVKEDGTIVET